MSWIFCSKLLSWYLRLFIGKWFPYCNHDPTWSFSCPKTHWLGVYPLIWCKPFLADKARARRSSDDVSGGFSIARRDIVSFRVSRCRLCLPTCHAASPAMTWIWMNMLSSQERNCLSLKAPSSSKRMYFGLGRIFNQSWVKAFWHSMLVKLDNFFFPVLTILATWKSVPSSRKLIPTANSLGFPDSSLWGLCHQNVSTLTASHFSHSLGTAEVRCIPACPRCLQKSHSNFLAASWIFWSALASFNNRHNTVFEGWPKLACIVRNRCKIRSWLQTSVSVSVSVCFSVVSSKTFQTTTVPWVDVLPQLHPEVLSLVLPKESDSSSTNVDYSYVSLLSWRFVQQSFGWRCWYYSKDHMVVKNVHILALVSVVPEVP